MSVVLLFKLNPPHVISPYIIYIWILWNLSQIRRIIHMIASHIRRVMWIRDGLGWSHCWFFIHNIIRYPTRLLHYTELIYAWYNFFRNMTRNADYWRLFFISECVLFCQPFFIDSLLYCIIFYIHSITMWTDDDFQPRDMLLVRLLFKYMHGYWLYPQKNI